jgi:hypothetical protein
MTSDAANIEAEAVAALRSALGSHDTPWAVKVAAAKALLDLVRDPVPGASRDAENRDPGAMTLDQINEELAGL